LKDPGTADTVTCAGKEPITNDCPESTKVSIARSNTSIPTVDEYNSIVVPVFPLRIQEKTIFSLYKF
jgi:hypothetical protein